MRITKSFIQPPPLEKGLIWTSEFEEARRLDHRKLLLRCRVVDGDASRLGEYHHEERGSDQRVAGSDDRGDSEQSLVDNEWDGGPRYEGDREEDHDEGRLGQRGDEACSTCAKPSVGTAAVHRREVDEEAADPDHKPGPDHVRH